MQFDSRIHAQADEHPLPLVFVTVSGAHLYGFPSPDSDYDLRGAHVLPVRDIAGLGPGREAQRVARRILCQAGAKRLTAAAARLSLIRASIFLK